MDEERIETTILTIWRDVLGARDLDANTSFFDAGGTSLLATRLASRLRATLGAEVSAGDLLVFPSPHLLARHLAPRDEAPAAPASSGLMGGRAAQQRASFGRFRSTSAKEDTPR